MDDKQAEIDEDAEDDIVARAAADAAARAESVNPPKSGSLLKQSSSFRPHMHVQMQALSAKRIGSSFSSRSVVVVLAAAAAAAAAATPRAYCSAVFVSDALARVAEAAIQLSSDGTKGVYRSYPSR